MQLINTDNKFGIVSIFLHWSIAILIIALLMMGFCMVWIPLNPLKISLFRWHKEIGMLTLMLVVLRLIWRLVNLIPSLIALPLWEQLVATFVHWIFYFFMLALPISGWILSSAAGLSVSFYNWFIFPNLVASNEKTRIMMTLVHQWLSYGLILILGLHIAASLKHHFINRDNILRRMLWP